MKRVTSIATATVMALLVAMTLSSEAQLPDTRDLTIMTFSNPVEMPGMRLEAGTYAFQIADSPNRNVLQVWTEDRKHLVGQWHFAAATRLDVTGDNVVTFRETSAGSTPAVQFWYYPGEKIGKEFIYPKDQALRIAQRTGGTVLTEEGHVTIAASTPIAQPSSVQAEAQVAPAQEQGAVVIQTERAAIPPAETQVEAVGTTGSADAPRAEGTYAQNELPRTASPLPLTGLIALLSLAGAAGLRAFRR